MRRYVEYNLTHIEKFKAQLLVWSKTHQHAIILNSNDYSFKNKSPFAYHTYEFLAGIGAKKTLSNFESFNSLINNEKDWWFGFITYDCKNEIENLTSNNLDNLGLPQISFFQPEFVFIIHGATLKIGYFSEQKDENYIDELFNAIQKTRINKIKNTLEFKIKSRFSKEEYLKSVRLIKNHIQIGDVYELNFCQEYFIDNESFDPYALYLELNKISPTPFSCFVKFDDKYLISASPERFIKKSGNKVISQPIKGTIKRGKSKNEDRNLIQQLRSSQKDIAENTMIVDLVRNDLSRIAKKASVKVEELCGIYSYQQVHQMISTVSAEIQDEINPLDIIKATFPMGSMTGAPKIKAMELIEKYERTKRGLYSGSVGYIDPQQNFDFNVVIRSILYNSTQKYLSFMVGGAITSLSDPEEEYKECLLKAKAIKKVLSNED